MNWNNLKNYYEENRFFWRAGKFRSKLRNSPDLPKKYRIAAAQRKAENKRALANQPTPTLTQKEMRERIAVKRASASK
jgi:hypothetical protein